MASPETSNSSTNSVSKFELLIELQIIDELIQPFLETALAVDEIKNYENLLEERETILDDLGNYD
ncbi:MAG: hypothetical protein AAFY41_10445 [Bacteroidota bacterium]